MTYITDGVGLLGVAVTILMYLLLQTEKLASTSFSYSFWNGVGSVMIIYSLFFAWNIASFLMELIWLGISGYGAWKAFKSSKRKVRQHRGNR
ncbi:hypothetical protein FJ364_03585 [Candidatus Dependentiae bacterium]|nr:hypothetical protein [Candidatus Dependentiae bacterium]